MTGISGRVRTGGHRILGSWSGMRKYLEKEMISDSLKGRIRYSCTAYPGMDGCHIFEMFVDGRVFKRFSWETVNSYFIDHGRKKNNEPYGVREYWEDFWELTESIPVTERDEYTDGEFCGALAQYRENEIGASLQSVNPLVRMFAVLDRRVGKRTLLKIKENAGNQDNQPDWLKTLYTLRFDAEGLSEP